MSFNLILGTCLGLKSQRQALTPYNHLGQEGFMDPTTEYLSDYASRLTYQDLSPAAVHQVKRTLIVALGCGVGAFDSEPASIARRMASRVQGNPPARIL